MRTRVKEERELGIDELRKQRGIRENKVLREVHRGRCITDTREKADATVKEKTENSERQKAREK